MALNSFSATRAQSPQFVHYNGPPKPKRASQRPPSNPSSSTAQGNEDDFVVAEEEVETVDLTQLTDNEGDSEVGHKRGESGEVDEVGEADGWGGAPVPTSREDVGDQEPCQEMAHKPVPTEGCDQGTALAIDGKRSDLDADSDDSDEENVGPQLGDQFEAPSASTIESYEEEVAVRSIGTVIPETTDGAEIPELSHGRSPSTPPTSPSIVGIQQSTRKRRTEKRLEREAKLLSTGSISSSSSSSGSDADDDDLGGECTTALIRKRKHFPTTNGTSHKRRSQGLARKASTNPTKSTLRRRNLFPSRKTATSSRSSVSRYATGAHFAGDGSSEGSDYQTHNLQKGPKSIVSNRGNIGYSCTQDEELLATHAPPHTTDWTPPVEAQWHLSGTTLHSISTNMSFLTALFRAHSGSGILSARHAVRLLENAVGLSMKLDDATIRFLAPDTWVLTSLVDHLPGVAGGGTGQPSLVLPSLRSGRAATTPHLEYGQSSNDLDDEASSDGFDVSEEESCNMVDEPSSFRKNSRWSKEEDESLRRWREKGKSWDWTCSQFPNRTPAAVKTRWHTKLRGEARQS